ncbi:D-hexose-6-phosphate mutarotase [Pseudomonas saudiphocaensis]|uniref:D-hexose-6-phosphate mutarotase n=1 Tax=Pseudomonas saudiphocaensis TaxID=1499686 RepID=UPI00187D3B97|nr:D-hexose-6-phosphate mutarotase [Pseudomonas saudiphocaensis]MBE7926307.1 D-hexose-6-phosphate mutarotase [Pseudomonas saudiphocaensis]
MSVDIQRIVMDQLACWRIRRGDDELLIAEQGAQVLSYRQGDMPVIWLSEDAAFTRGQSVRGGVPICWPWFGDLSRNPDEVQAMHQGEAEAPFHGLVRGLDWQLEQQRCEDGAGILIFACPQALGELPGWPHHVDLKLQIRLDERLHISLTSHNLSDRPVAISQALHSYFAVGDIQQVSVQGLDGRRYIETLEDWQQRQQQGDLKINGETDRIYLDLPPVLHLLDPTWKRRISLETSGSNSAILWNPWIDKAQRLSQFADDAWQRMLCIETANVMDDRILLDAGASHTLAVSIGSEPL